MTIEEAITKSRAIAKNQNYTEAGRAHDQLADWLEELVLLRFQYGFLNQKMKEMEQRRAFDNITSWEDGMGQ